jgi:DNA primase
LDECRARVPLSGVIGRRVKLIRVGREYKACCPFHQENTPSFYVNDQKGFFHCFGCGAHGDSIGFLMRHDGLRFMEAVKSLADEAGLEVPKPDAATEQRHALAQRLHAVNETAAAYFMGQLFTPRGRAARDYLRDRGLSDEVIARYRLGYAPADASELLSTLKRAGAAEDDMIAAGLIRRADDDPDRLYGFFRHRVMIPIGDRQDRIIAFGARLLDGHGPKYLNSAETPVFHKGETLFGLGNARTVGATGAPIIAVEGYFDVIALAEAGWRGAVAPLGTAMTEGQLNALWRLGPSGEIKRPILCFDGDNAGLRAAARAVERALPLLTPERSLRFTFLPQGEDPDSLLRCGRRRELEQHLDGARPLFDVLWQFERMAMPDDSPEARSRMGKVLRGRIDQIGDQDLRRAYHDDLSRMLRASRARSGASQGWSQGGRLGRSERGYDQGYGRSNNRRKDWRGVGETIPPRPVGLEQARDAARRKRRNPFALLVGMVVIEPVLMEDVGEALAMISFPETALEDIRAALVALYGAGASAFLALDTDAIKNHLRSSVGDVPVVDLLAQTKAHARATRKRLVSGETRAYEYEKLVGDWWQMHTRWHHISVLRQQLRQAQRELDADPTPQRQRCFEILQQQLCAAERRAVALDPAELTEPADASDPHDP